MNKLNSTCSFILYLLIVNCNLCMAGPFGLEWGSTIEENDFINKENCEESSITTLIVCVSDIVPNNIQYAMKYELGFSRVHGLQNILFISMDINDKDIPDGVMLYEKFKNVLMSKYGSVDFEYEYSCAEEKDNCDIGLDVVSDFYLCLADSDCGRYISSFNSNGISIELRLLGKDTGVGFITLDYNGPSYDSSLNDNLVIDDKELLDNL